jgi:hypothetical protein
MYVIQRPQRLLFYDRVSVERLCFSCAALFDKPCRPATARKLEDHVFVLSCFYSFIGFLMSSNFQTALERHFSKPQSHVVLKMQGDFDPQELEQFSTKWWEPLFCGYYLDCWANDTGMGFIHFRDFSFGTKLLSAQKIQAIKEVFSKAFNSHSNTEWELKTFNSLRDAHVYMGLVRS